MKPEETVFLNILSAFLNKTEYAPESFEGFEKTADFADLHGLTGVIYPTLGNRAALPKELSDRLKAAYLQTLLYSSNRDDKYSLLCRMLRDNSILFVPFKGSVIKKYYPVPELRTMSDVDIVIDSADRTRLHELLLSSGYESRSTIGDDWVYATDGLLLEVHTNPFITPISSKIDISGYYADFWRLCEKTDEGMELKPENHLVLLIAHAAKHFYESGCGLRQIYDIAIFCSAAKPDFAAVNAQLQKTGLSTFAGTLATLCKKWFNADINIPLAELSDNDYNELCRFIFDGGIYGFNNFKTSEMLLRKQLDFHGSENSLKAFLKRVFVGRERINDVSPVTKKYPVLIPAGWIKWCWISVFKRWSHTSSVARGLFSKKDKEEAQEKLLMMRKIGL